MNQNEMIRRVMDLFERIDGEHGTTNGVRTCKGNELSQHALLSKEGHACSKCLAYEKLGALEDILE